MKILKYREKLLQLDQLIRLKATGTPCVLARKLNVCESTVYNLLNIMRELADEQNAGIIFDNYSESYYYSKVENILNPEKDITNFQNDLNVDSEMLIIYPNPSKGNFSISIPGELSAGAKIEIYDITGKLLYNTNGFSISEELIIIFSLGEKTSFFTGLSLNSIFSKFIDDSDLIIPANYIGNNKNVINQLKLKLGYIYKF